MVNRGGRWRRWYGAGRHFTQAWLQVVAHTHTHTHAHIAFFVGTFIAFADLNPNPYLVGTSQNGPTLQKCPFHYFGAQDVANTNTHTHTYTHIAG